MTPENLLETHCRRGRQLAQAFGNAALAQMCPVKVAPWGTHPLNQWSCLKYSTLNVQLIVQVTAGIGVNPHLGKSSLEETPTRGPRLHSALAKTHTDPRTAPLEEPPPSRSCPARFPGDANVEAWKSDFVTQNKEKKGKGLRRPPHKRNKKARGLLWFHFYESFFFGVFKGVQLFLRRHRRENWI